MDALYAGRPTPFGPREFVKVLACGLILVIVQSALSALAGLAGYGPEWMLPLALYVALRSELWAAALAAFCLGFFRDSAGGLLLGLWALTLVMLVWLFYPYRSRLNFFSPLTLTPLVFILALGGYLFIMTPIMAILGWPEGGFNPLPGFFVSSLATALTSPPLFVFLRWLTGGGSERS
ncbi:MAG: rod shape-determining protein MreD [Candidatus Adiutrix sp.]|jgi:rod shape-determining protein MreD|nr:rod shape-determining protein MreD [Candidatus Adiutrix sp.]